MRPLFHKVPMQKEASFSIAHNIIPNFRTQMHYHPEYELHLVINGEGVRFIGDNISNFSPGEVILLGENIPHGWHCKEEYFRDKSLPVMETMVIHFSPDFLGSEFLSLPEARLLPLLFEKAKGGLLFLKDTRKKLTDLMQRASESEDLDRIILLLSTLKILSESSEFQLISKKNSFFPSDEFQTERLNNILNYTMANYGKDIKLEQVAATSNLTVTSFCRYFKLITKKSYYTYLTEIRISHACQFLIEDRFSIDQIAEKCGFFNISNFYRQFKKTMGITPLNYRRMYFAT
ncbi:MAG: AraC family transcriptional regulator [Ginsengibacter sp.]